MKGLIRLATRSRRLPVGRYTVSSSSHGSRRTSRIGRMTHKPKVSRANNSPSSRRLRRYF